MWCFDLAYIDRTSWKDYNHMFNELAEDANEDSKTNEPFNFLMTTAQLHRYTVRRTRQNEDMQQGEEEVDP